MATWNCNPATTEHATQQQPSGYLDLQHSSNVNNVTEEGRREEEEDQLRFGVLMRTQDNTMRSQDNTIRTQDNTMSHTKIQ